MAIAGGLIQSTRSFAAHHLIFGICCLASFLSLQRRRGLGVVILGFPHTHRSEMNVAGSRVGLGGMRNVCEPRTGFPLVTGTSAGRQRFLIFSAHKCSNKRTHRLASGPHAWGAGPPTLRSQLLRNVAVALWVAGTCPEPLTMKAALHSVSLFVAFFLAASNP